MTYPAWAWDTSGKTLRKVKVGETISYSGYGRCVTHHICDCKYAELERLREEVARLRRLVEDHKQERKSMGKANAKMAVRAENAEDELERLREALRELSFGAKSALSLYVPAASITHDELKYGLELAARESEDGEPE